MTQLTSDTA